jgi:hypothetical protein
MSVLDPNSLGIPNPVSDLAGGVPKYVFFEGGHVDIQWPIMGHWVHPNNFGGIL